MLIADDDPLFACALAARCRTLGLEPVVVADGLEALAQAARHPPPDLILLDAQMPLADGPTVARKLAEHPALRECPVILVTGRTDAGTLRRCEAASVRHLLLKGAQLWDHLRPLVEEVVRGRRRAPASPPSAEAATAAEAGAAVAARRRPRLVLADDDPLFLDHLAARLRALGADVATAGCGEHAYRAVLRLNPDLVITDYAMPDGDGGFVLGRIRANPLTRDIPVLVLTARAGGTPPDHALIRELRGRGGAAAVLPKPADLGALIGTLRRLGVAMAG